MTYEIGYGRPPRSCQFRNGQSGNPSGRKKSPPRTSAMLVEQAWMTPMTVDGKTIIPFEVIVMRLVAAVAGGSSKAHRVLRNYETFAKTKPRIKRRKKLFANDQEAAAAYAAIASGNLDWDDVVAGRGKWSPPSPPASQTPEEQKQAEVAKLFEDMRAGRVPIQITPDMTHDQAAELYHLTLKLPPPPPPRPRPRNPKNKKLSAGEIFDRVVNGTISKGSTSRMKAMITNLLIKALKGELDAMDGLYQIHAYSLKHGDFVLQIKYVES